MTTSGRKFFSATSIKSVWEDTISELCSQLENARGTLGILYVSEDLLPNLENILNRLRLETNCNDWLGAAGYGVLSNVGEFYGETSATVLLLDLPKESLKSAKMV